MTPGPANIAKSGRHFASGSTPVNNFAQKWTAIRADVFRAAALALLTVLLWCGFYNRWTAESWSLPLVYPVTPVPDQLDRGDATLFYAEVKAARDGHFAPFEFKNVPELGAPYGANWNDFPITEYFQYYLPGVLARFIGIFAAVNFTVMMEYVLAALAFYAACRLSKWAWHWSFAGALIFAFARYAYAHGAHHITCTYYWHISLCLLVCRWMFLEEGGIKIRDWKFIFALAVAFVTGVQNPYYTNMFAQFVLIAGLVRCWRARDWRAGIPAAGIIGTAAASFLLMNMGMFVYHLRFGPNQGAVDRTYRWLEIYGLKLVDMVMPPPDHRFPLFALWERSHIYSTDLRNPNILLSPGELPPTAYLGLVALAILVWLVIVSLRRAVQREKLPLEAWMFLWIYVYSDVGGINGVIGTLGFLLFRATTRYSIWILCILLMYGVRRLSTMDVGKWIVDTWGESPWSRWFPYGFACAAVFIALFDQNPPAPTDAELQNIASYVESDRHFAQTMERALPPGAMIFQIPIMLFPESPYPNVASYDNFRPYLYSRNLRYSFGSDKGRPREDWQIQIAQIRSLDVLIHKLEQYGFAGLYVNRNAFPTDNGEGLLQKLRSMGYDDVITSPKGDLYCVILKPSPHPILPEDDRDAETIQDNPLSPE